MKSRVACLVTLFACSSASFSAIAAKPSWWQSPQFQNQGGGQFATGATSDGGELTVSLNNLAQEDHTKHLYFVLNWDSPDKDATMKVLGFSWSDVIQTGVFQGGKLEADTSQEKDGRFYFTREYSFTIPIQPDKDYARLSWTLPATHSDIRYTWDFRSFCTPVPEPETQALLLAGVAVCLAIQRKPRHKARQPSDTSSPSIRG